MNNQFLIHKGLVFVLLLAMIGDIYSMEQNNDNNEQATNVYCEKNGDAEENIRTVTFKESILTAKMMQEEWEKARYNIRDETVVFDCENIESIESTATLDTIKTLLAHQIRKEIRFGQKLSKLDPRVFANMQNTLVRFKDPKINKKMIREINWHLYPGLKQLLHSNMWPSYIGYYGAYLLYAIGGGWALWNLTEYNACKKTAVDAETECYNDHTTPFSVSFAGYLLSNAASQYYKYIYEPYYPNNVHVEEEVL